MVGRQIVQVYPSIVGETFTWTPVGFSSSDVAKWEWYFQVSKSTSNDWLRVDNHGLSIVPSEGQEGGKFKLIVTFGSRLEISGTTWPVLGRHQAAHLLEDDSFSKALRGIAEESSAIKALLKKVQYERKQIQKAYKTEEKLAEIKALKIETDSLKRAMWEAQNIESRERELKKRGEDLDLGFERMGQERARLGKERDEFKKKISADLRMVSEKKDELLLLENHQREQIEIERLKLRREIEKFMEDRDLQEKISEIKAIREQLELELSQVEGLPFTWGRMSHENRHKISEIISNERAAQNRDKDQKSRDRARKIYGADDRWT